MGSEVGARGQVDVPDPDQEETSVWCGGYDEGQDVAIHLVPRGTALDHLTDTLLVLKVHSHRLSHCSKYFEACLSERWRKPSSTPTTILFLEVQTDVKYYISCFSRMYSPFLKEFHGVAPSMELLKVASQIEFQELLEAVSRFVAAIPWSSEEELRIREYSTSPDFPACHVRDLVARLGLNMTDEDRHKRMCGVVEECTRTALHHDGSFKNTRAFLEELLQGIQGSGTPSNVARTVVSIVSAEAKGLFDVIGKACEEKGFYHLVPHFTEKLLSICWVLKALLNARVAEELVRYMVELDAFATIVANVNCFNGPEPCKKAAFELAKLVLQTYSEVLDGHLILTTAERTALLRNWHVLLESHVSKDSYYLLTKSFFITLPLEQQTELIKLRKDRFTGYIDASSLVALLKRSWPALESEQGQQLSQPGCEVFSSPSPSNPSFGSPSHEPASPCSG